MKKTIIKNNFVLCLLLFLCPVVTHAQAPALQWQKSYGGYGSDLARSVKQTNDGGYVFAAYTDTIDPSVSGFHGGGDYWLVKTNANGDIQWQKCYGGAYGEVVYDMQLTMDGGFVIAGIAWFSDGDVGTTHGDEDYWVVKTDSVGNLQWAKCYGGSDIDRPYSVQQTTDGGYIVAGFSASNNGDVTGNHFSSNDYWVVKLDTGGNIQWQKSLGGSSDDVAYSVRQTTDGGYVVAGRSESINGDVTGHHGSVFCWDYWIVKLDSAGILQWQRSLGGTDTEEAQSIWQTTDGGYIVAGNTASLDGDVTGNHSGNQQNDCWIVKLDTAGSIQWEHCFGGTEGEYAYSVKQTGDSGYIFAGLASSTDGDVTGNHGSLDYWVVKLGSSGSLEWEKCYGGTGSDVARSIELTTDGGYIVVGYSNSVDGDITDNYSGTDCWLVKLEGTASINEQTATENNLYVFPNPANDNLTVEIANDAKGIPSGQLRITNIAILDISGRQVKSIKTKGHNKKYKIDVKDLPAGIYFVKLRAKNKVYVSKVVLQKK